MSKLDELAAKGKANDRRAIDAEAREKAEKVAKDVLERDRNRWRALSRWGLLTGELWWLNAFWLLFCPLTVACILIMVKLDVSDTVAHIIMPGSGRLYLPLPVIVVMFIAIKYAKVAVRRAVERERRWLDSLPFKVTGYLECLGSYYRDNESEITLKFEFASGHGPRELRAILASDGGTWEVRDGRAKRDPGPSTSFKEDHNVKVVRWFHKLVAKQLMPLHAECPILAIDMTNADDALQRHRAGK